MSPPLKFFFSPKSPFQTKSINFEGGVDDFMATDEQTTAPRIGIDNDFTVAFWFKPSTLPVSGAGTMLSVTDDDGVTASKFFIAHDNIEGIRWLCLAPTGSIRQNITWNNLLTGSNNVWRHIVMVYDSPGNGAGQRTLYFDGVDEGEGDVLSTNNTCNIPDNQNRLVSVATSSAIGGRFNGRVASIAMWDDLLTSDEVTAIYNNRSIKFNLSEDSGLYTSSADLVHWFELGNQPSPLLGTDSATPTNPLDLEEAAGTGITNEDRVADVP